MMKLVYYVGDTVVKEKEVTIDEVDSAVYEIELQDYKAIGIDPEKCAEYDEDGYFDGYIGLKLENKGWLVWQNSEGKRGFDFDVKDLDIDDRVKAAVSSLY